MIWLIVLVGAVIWGLKGLSNRVTITRTVYTRYYCPNHEGEFVLEGSQPSVQCPYCVSTLHNMEAQFDEGHENLR